MTRDYLLTLIANAGLLHIADALEELLLDSIHLMPQEIDMEQIEIGESRIGGVPDLPQNTAWPEWKGFPLAFIAQIRLSDLAHIQEQEVTKVETPSPQFPLFDLEPELIVPREVASIAYNILPKTGILYFFAFDNSEHQIYEWVKERDAWRILYCRNENADTLVRLQPPGLETGNPYYLEVSQVSWWRELTLPGVDAYDIEQLRLSPTEQESYRHLVSDLEAAQGLSKLETHRLLGHPRQIQSNMQVDCQLLSDGHYYKAKTGFIGAGMATLSDELAARDWQFLLQIQNGWGGCLYYWMPSVALQQQDFSQAWLILQYD